MESGNLLSFIENTWITKGLSSMITLIVGVIIMRLAGKKNIAQMTLTSVIFLLILGSTLGTFLVKPEETLLMIFTATIVLLMLKIMEKFIMKFDFFEKLLVGKAEILIENGEIYEDKLKENNYTLDQVKMQLRNKGVTRIEQCKYIAIEPNGDISYELKEGESSISLNYFNKRIDEVLKRIDNNKKPIDKLVINQNEQTNKEQSIEEESETKTDMFKEVDNNNEEENKTK